MVNFIQPSFAKGELAPNLHGRVDTAAYQVGLRTARNLIVHPYGGASNRPGSQWIGPVKTHSYAPRLVDFEFKTDDQYVLEFGNLYMRVIRNDGHVLNTATNITAVTQATPGVVTAAGHGISNGQEVYITGVVGMTQLNGNRYIAANITANTFELTHQVTGDNINTNDMAVYTSGGTVARIYEITTPYVTADLDTLKLVQSADVMTITHKSYEPRELSRTGHTSWTLTTFKPNPITIPPTAIVATAGTVGAASSNYKITSLGDSDESLPGLRSTGSTAITAITKANPAVVTIAGHNFVNGEEVYINGVVGMTEVNIRRFTVANKAANTIELMGEDSTNYTAWSSGGICYHTNVEILNNNISAITVANPGVITVTAGHGVVAGETFMISGVVGMTQVNNRSFVATAVTQTTITFENTTGYTAYTSGGSLWKPNTANITLSWTGDTTATQGYAVYKNSNGIYGKIGETTTTTFTDNNLFVDISEGPPEFSEPFHGTDNYPGTANFFEQRRVFGGSTNNPDTSWYSRTGLYKNFSTTFPTQDDDAITATLAARQVNEIRHYVPGNDLIILTNGSEWRVNSGPDAAFSAITIKQKPQSTWGSSHHRPIISGNVTLYIEENNAAVRSLGYSIQLDGYTGTNLCLLANHLLMNNTIVDWCYTHSHESRAYMVRDDGQVLTMTFDPDQEVIAWTHWETDGFYERTVSLRHGSDSIADKVYFVVKRTINGNTVRYIEKMCDRNIEDIKDACFLDCNLPYDLPITITGSTAANPVVITATSHGFSNGDEVDISDILWEATVDANFNEEQPDQLNGYRYTIANTTANTFELSGVNGTAFNAYVSGGKVRKAVLTLAGLDHLEGEEVTILADGSVITGKSISSGSVTLDSKASRIQIGFPFIADFETLDIEAPSGTIQGHLIKIPDVTIRMEKTRGILVGPNNDQLTEIKFREFENMSAPTDMFTGDKEQILPPNWDSMGRIFIRQPYPLPMTILAVIPNIQTIK